MPSMKYPDYWLRRISGAQAFGLFTQRPSGSGQQENLASKSFGSRDIIRILTLFVNESEREPYWLTQGDRKGSVVPEPQGERAAFEASTNARRCPLETAATGRAPRSKQSSTHAMKGHVPGSACMPATAPEPLKVKGRSNSGELEIDAGIT